METLKRFDLKYLLPIISLPFFIGVYFLINSFTTQKQPVASVESNNEEVMVEGINSEVPGASDKLEQPNKLKALRDMIKNRAKNSKLATLRDSDKLSENDSASNMEKEESLASSYLEKIEKRKTANKNAAAQRDKLRKLAENKARRNRKEQEDRKLSEQEKFALQMRVIDSISNPEKYAVKDTVPATEKKEALAISKNKYHRSSGNFYTIKANKDETMISAILDEGIKVWDGSRVRVRLLEPIYINEHNLEKGTYLYGIVSGLENQRVKIDVTSVVVNDIILPLDVTLYDNDGIEGIYVPASDFQKFVKDVGQQSATNLRYNDNGPKNSSQMIYESLSDAVRSSSRAIRKALRKNKANLKYNTEVYLVNNK